MNKETECKIVKDLAIPFIDKSVTQETEKFIREHLDICNDCKKYYETIAGKENIENKYKDDIMINHLKKVHRHISILKISLLVISLLIMSIFLIYFTRNKELANIMDMAYNNVEHMKELNNYKLVVKTIQRDLKTNTSMGYEQNYYYKDGKYKVEAEDSIKFYEDDSLENISVYHELQTIEYNKQNFVEKRKGSIINVFSSEILNYEKIKSTIYSLALSLRTERYNGIECYVIRMGNDNSYRDIWLDKNKFITIRIVSEDYLDFYREEIYTFSENIVNDKDVNNEILNTDKYKNYTRQNIINNTSEETKLYYELYKTYHS